MLTKEQIRDFKARVLREASNIKDLVMGRDISWEEVTKYDQIVPAGEKRILNKINELNLPICEFLRLDGKHFYYCGTGIPENLESKMGAFDPIYQKRVGIKKIVEHCRNDFETCPFYKNEKSKK